MFLYLFISMSEKCPFCNIEHDELIDKVSEEASDVAMEFTEKSFDKIWNFGGESMASKMSQKDAAKMMFHTGATQMLTEHLLNEHEDLCKSKD